MSVRYFGLVLIDARLSDIFRCGWDEVGGALKTIRIAIALIIVIVSVLEVDARPRRGGGAANLPFCIFCFGAIQTLEKQDRLPDGSYLGNLKSSYYFLGGVYAGSRTVIYIDGESYSDLPTGSLLDQLQSDGMLPDPIPSYGLSFWDILFGYSTWIGLAIVLLPFIAGGILLSTKPTVRTLDNGSFDGASVEELFGSALLGSLCVIARADGRIDPGERELLLSILADNSDGSPLSDAKIDAIVNESDRSSLTPLLQFLSNKISDDAKMGIVRATLAMASADGEINELEMNEIHSLMAALGVSEQLYENTLNSLLAAS